MELNENGNADKNPVTENNNPTPVQVAAPGAGIDLPAQPAARQLRNQHLKVGDPKNKQFTARCTEAEEAIIKRAMTANGCTDIVRLMLYSIKLHQNDLLSPFKI